MSHNARILPFARPEKTDREWADEEHFALFDHYPQPGPNGKCQHPMHAQMRRLIDGPGVYAEVTFDPNYLVSTDDERVVAAERAYEAKVERERARIAEFRERQAYLDRKDPDRVRQRHLKRAERRRLEREIAKMERRHGK